MENLTQVKLRGLPGALVLGLLASLVAHTLAYGDSHAQAGPLHTAFYGLAAFGLLALTVWALALAATRAGAYRDGSILAAHLARYCPGKTMLALASVGWFTLGESLEPAHAPAAFLLIAAALVAAVLGVRALARLLLRTIAAIAIAIVSSPFAPRRSLRVRTRRAPAPRPQPGVLRRPVTRPPPMSAIVPA